MSNQNINVLTALRGVMALVVVLDHEVRLLGSTVLDPAARGAVIVFFALSGYVLARAYDGRPALFLLRRAIRLWPVYAVCLTAGHAVLGDLPAPAELVWWPDAAPLSMAADGPVWTLYIEAWITPVLPIMFVVAAWRRAAAMALPVACAALGLMHPLGYIAAVFAAGAAAAQFDIRWPEIRQPAALWLGTISYSLYASHCVVLGAFGPWGLVAVLPVAVLVWLLVERPAIGWSQRVGHIARASGVMTGPQHRNVAVQSVRRRFAV